MKSNFDIGLGTRVFDADDGSAIFRYARRRPAGAGLFFGAVVGIWGQNEKRPPNSPVKERATTVLEGLTKPRGASAVVPAA